MTWSLQSSCKCPLRVGSLDPWVNGASKGPMQWWSYGPPKWMMKIMENPIKMDDLGVPPMIFSEARIFLLLFNTFLHQCVSIGSFSCRPISVTLRFWVRNSDGLVFLNALNLISWMRRCFQNSILQGKTPIILISWRNALFQRTWGNSYVTKTQRSTGRCGNSSYGFGVYSRHVILLGH